MQASKAAEAASREREAYERRLDTMAAYVDAARAAAAAAASAAAGNTGWPSPSAPSDPASDAATGGGAPGSPPLFAELGPGAAAAAGSPAARSRRGAPARVLAAQFAAAAAAPCGELGGAAGGGGLRSPGLQDALSAAEARFLDAASGKLDLGELIHSGSKRRCICPAARKSTRLGSHTFSQLGSIYDVYLCRTKVYTSPCSVLIAGKSLISAPRRARPAAVSRRQQRRCEWQREGRR